MNRDVRIMVRRLARLHVDRCAKGPADRLRVARPGGRADALSSVTAELAPNAVPSRRWLWPVRWLFYVKPSTISCTPEDAADVTLEQFNQRGF
jgi:hypothetical protein